ncbi:hypothetical protein BDZ94DRAFT_1256775 [Collybia nuda]|uniref:Uncharacterized protein n=1 Tax=Collybia nuda TaxID=64659 RepID=A0A9P5Y8W4_9AGAR|nr:hypothetical protein BDZ94DRAFT_1256775 [Collybia nuda]
MSHASAHVTLLIESAVASKFSACYAIFFRLKCPCSHLRIHHGRWRFCKRKDKNQDTSSLSDSRGLYCRHIRS